MSEQRRALLIVDNQLGFRNQSHWGPARSNPRYEQNVHGLLDAFRTTREEPNPLVIHIVHHSTLPNSPLHPSKDTSAINPNTAPINGEPIIIKSVNSGFIGTNLEAMLREHRINKLYIAGMTTDHCVSTTTRMAGNLHVTDYVIEDGTTVKGEVILIGDATACFQKTATSWDSELVHAVHVESLEEFATITSTNNVLAELNA